MQLQALDDEHLQAGAEAAVMDEEEQKMFETDQFRWAGGASYDRDRVACGVNYDQELGQRPRLGVGLLPRHFVLLNELLLQAVLEGGACGGQQGVLAEQGRQKLLLQRGLFEARGQLFSRFRRRGC